MDVNYLIQVLERKVIILNNAKAQAFSMGDLDALNSVDQELLSVQSTLMQLNLLASVTAAAAASNSDTASILSNAIQTTQDQMVAPSASDIVNGYDISTYATDPSFEQNINNLLSAMPAFASASSIDTYIQRVAPSSPVTGNMVVNAAEMYNIDEPLLIALMQNDSNFGTLGVGARTNNPGNVGNTGVATHTYDSWEAGVSAVAAWLNEHRVVQVVPVSAPTPAAVLPIPDIPTDTATSTSTPADATTTPDMSVISPISTTTPDIVIGDDAATSTATTTPSE